MSYPWLVRPTSATVVLARRSVLMMRMYSSSPSSRSGGHCVLVLTPATFSGGIGFPDAAPLVQMVTVAGSVPSVQLGWTFMAVNQGYPNTRSSGPMSAM